MQPPVFIVDGQRITISVRDAERLLAEMRRLAREDSQIGDHDRAVVRVESAMQLGSSPEVHLELGEEEAVLAGLDWVASLPGFAKELDRLRKALERKVIDPEQPELFPRPFFLGLRTPHGVCFVSQDEIYELGRRLRRRDDAQGGPPGNGTAVAAMLDRALEREEGPEVTLTPLETEALYAELDAWLVEEDSERLGERLMTLRSALQAELGLGIQEPPSAP